MREDRIEGWTSVGSRYSRGEGVGLGVRVVRVLGDRDGMVGELTKRRTKEERGGRRVRDASTKGSVDLEDDIRW